jgi:hypothetical protein
MLGIDFSSPIQRNGRPGAIAKQAPPTMAIVAFDAHDGIDRESHNHHTVCGKNHENDAVFKVAAALPTDLD